MYKKESLRFLMKKVSNKRFYPSILQHASTAYEMKRLQNTPFLRQTQALTVINLARSGPFVLKLTVRRDTQNSFLCKLLAAEDIRVTQLPSYYYREHNTILSYLLEANALQISFIS
jgi:hypothetical protein